MSSERVPIVAIVGRANVGKSSLFNAILARREAIVAHEAGTTRDNVMAKATWNGQDFWLVDTAGIKTAEDDFEFTIQEQILQAADSADVIWVVVEANVPITEEDRRVAKMALKSRKPVFLVINKVDKAKGQDLIAFERLGIKPIVQTSTTQHRGIGVLLDLLVEKIPKAQLREDGDRLRIALIGRPNVGKSSLFNSLAKKQQAVVASRAGTTRDINRAIVRYNEREVEIMDTAGIRRPGKIGTGIEHFSVVRTLAAIEQSDICLLLMDANELNVGLDQKIAGMIKESGKGLVLVVSKWDAVEGRDAFTRDALAPQIGRTYDFVPWAPLIFTSSETGQNVTKLFDLAVDIDMRRHKRMSTADLNRWLRQIVDKHPPAGLKNRAPKLNYMVQETDNAIPAFKVFGSHTKFLHWSYKRYMERELRERWHYEGTAIQLWFIEKHETHKHGNSPTKEERKNNGNRGRV
ncbi:MAG TPA: ribosome biogenesis GTPase Der [Candidatus Saccharimonadales bacterium]|nr:ribosome biogenesis GTPase Der [Candidatus Saccharimonadales bacterium]